MRETKRTIILIVLLCVIIGFIYWTQYNYQLDFEGSF